MTDTELRDAAVAALERTTVSYPDWLRRKAKGQYPDPSKTEWGKAFDYLAQIGAAAPPPPPPPPPPPTSTRRGPGYMRWANGEMPTTHVSDYDRVLVSFAGAASLGASSIPKERAGVYMSAISCQAPGDYDCPIDWNEARANGWVMRTASGGELVNTAYGNVPLGDPGNAGFAQRWAERANQLLDQWDLSTVFVDDFLRNYKGVSGGVECVKYPGPSNAPIPAYESALVSFASTVYSYLKARGKQVIWNCQGYIGGYAPSDTGGSELEYWPKILPYGDGFMSEYWLTSGWPPVNVRVGSNWKDVLRVPALVESAGKEFCFLWGGTDTSRGQYVILSALLETKPVCYWDAGWPNPWLPVYDRLLTLGNPTGSKVQNGNRWQRQYQGGLVWVDPVAVTSGIS